MRERINGVKRREGRASCLMSDLAREGTDMRDRREQNMLHIIFMSVKSTFQHCSERTVCILACWCSLSRKAVLFDLSLGPTTWTHSPLCTDMALPRAAEQRLNGLSGIILRLIGAQWLCIKLELCVTQNQSDAAVICETCCMCMKGPTDVPCDRVSDARLFFFFFCFLIMEAF